MIDLTVMDVATQALGADQVQAAGGATLTGSLNSLISGFISLLKNAALLVVFYFIVMRAAQSRFAVAAVSVSVIVGALVLFAINGGVKWAQDRFTNEVNATSASPAVVLTVDTPSPNLV